jgi:hypothetical protein
MWNSGRSADSLSLSWFNPINILCSKLHICLSFLCPKKWWWWLYHFVCPKDGLRAYLWLPLFRKKRRFLSSKHACTRKSQTVCLPRCLNTACTIHHLVCANTWRTVEDFFVLFEIWRDVNPYPRRCHPDIPTTSIKYTIMNTGLSYQLPINPKEKTVTQSRFPRLKKGTNIAVSYTCIFI